jgi:hypothetical protein
MWFLASQEKQLIVNYLVKEVIMSVLDIYVYPSCISQGYFSMALFFDILYRAIRGQLAWAASTFKTRY